MKLAQVLEFLGLTTSCEACELKTMQTDSRQVKPGDLFVAVPGINTDGRDYIPDAISKGAAAVLAEAPYVGPAIIVPNLRQKLPELAAFFYNYPAKNLKLIGITGTNGKTSCSHYTAQILTAAHQPCGVMGTLGNGMLPNLNPTNLTTSGCCTLQRQLAEFSALNVSLVTIEVSSHALDQQRLRGLNFDTAVFTNLSQDHLDYHKSMQEYFSAKTRLFTEYNIKHSVINLDDQVAPELIKLINKSVPVFTYSLSNPQADIYLKQDILITPWGSGSLRTQLLGDFNLSNLLACIACCALQGLKLESILAIIPTLTAVAGRMQKVNTTDSTAPLVVIDFAHTPDAIVKSLQALKGYKPNKLYCVFGCGGDRDRSKRPLMLRAALDNCDQVIITQDNPRNEDPQQIVADMLHGIEHTDNIKILLDRAAAIQNTIAQASAGDIIVIAGKGHENYQIIGDQKLPFSDLLIAQQALAVRGEHIWAI